jgi:molybdopterin/thiamine biosynthesis adenylyltransferase
MSLHPNPNIVGLHGNLMTDFGKNLFLEHDIVISCVDTQKCRAYINDWCVRTKTPFFEMGFDKYIVNITFFAPEGTMTQRDGTLIESLPTTDGYFPKFNGDFPVCLREEIGYGIFDEKRNSCSGFKVKDSNLVKIPTIQVSSAMAGTLIATELVKFLSGIDSIRNKMLLYSGLTYETTIVSYRRSPKCSIHDEKMNIEEFEVFKNESLKDILQRIEKSIEGCSRVFLTLPDVFIISGKCRGCGKEIEFNSRASELYDDERWCDECRGKHNYTSFSDYSNDFVKIPKELSLNIEDEFLEYTLQSVGVPCNDILECKINYRNGEKHWKFLFLRQID